MEIHVNSAAAVQLFLLFLLLIMILWQRKLKTGKRNEATKLKPNGVFEFLHEIYILLYWNPEIVNGQYVSRFVKLYKTFLSLNSRYQKGSYTLNLLGYTLFFATDYETISEINKKDAFLDRAPIKTLQLYSGENLTGMLFNNGEIWRISKTFVMKKFGRLGWKNKEKMTSILTEELSELLYHIEKLKKLGNNKIQIVGLFSSGVFNVITNFTFGKKFSADDPDFIYANNTFNDFVNMPITTVLLFHLLPNIWIFRGLITNISAIRDEIRNILKNLMEERIAITREAVDEDPSNIIDFFVQEIDKHKENPELNKVFCFEQLVGILQDLTLAGMDTTSKFLEYFLMYMCLYPDVQAKVQKEIDSVVGTSSLPRYFDCKSSMHYTTATCLEVHRITNIIPLMIRMTTKDVEIAGHFLKKGTFVIKVDLQIRLDELYWKTPFEFSPEHFLDDHGMLMQDKVDRMLLFSSGARSCPGENFANAASFTFAVGILQKYTVRKWDDSQILGEMGPTSPVNGPKPFNVKLLDR